MQLVLAAMTWLRASNELLRVVHYFDLIKSSVLPFLLELFFLYGSRAISRRLRAELLIATDGKLRF